MNNTGLTLQIPEEAEDELVFNEEKASENSTRKRFRYTREQKSFGVQLAAEEREAKHRRWYSRFKEKWRARYPAEKLPTSQTVGYWVKTSTVNIADNVDVFCEENTDKRQIIQNQAARERLILKTYPETRDIDFGQFSIIGLLGPCPKYDRLITNLPFNPVLLVGCENHRPTFKASRKPENFGPGLVVWGDRDTFIISNLDDDSSVKRTVVLYQDIRKIENSEIPAAAILGDLCGAISVKSMSTLIDYIRNPEVTANVTTLRITNGCHGKTEDGISFDDTFPRFCGAVLQAPNLEIVETINPIIYKRSPKMQVFSIIVRRIR